MRQLNGVLFVFEIRVRISSKDWKLGMINVKQKKQKLSELYLGMNMIFSFKSNMMKLKLFLIILILKEKFASQYKQKNEKRYL